MARFRVTSQQIMCDDCGDMVTVVAREPKNLGEGMTLAHVAVAWADSHFRCPYCLARATGHPSALRHYLHRFL